MPALTHRRVKNGFNLLPRTIIYAQGNCDNDKESVGQNMKEPTKWQKQQKLCDSSQRGLCCGRPLQYTSMIGGNLFRNSRIPTGPTNRKFATNVSVGRSFAAKRAIARRSATSKRIKDKENPDDRSKDKMKYCCLLPTVTRSQPVNAYNNPCSGGLVKKSLLVPCTNPTTSFGVYKKDLKSEFFK